MCKTKFSNYMTEARKSVNITQEQAAETLGTSSATIANWESGRSTPDATIVPSIIELYKLDGQLFKKNWVDALIPKKECTLTEDNVPWFLFTPLGTETLKQFVFDETDIEMLLLMSLYGTIPVEYTLKLGAHRVVKMRNNIERRLDETGLVSINELANFIAEHELTELDYRTLSADMYWIIAKWFDEKQPNVIGPVSLETTVKKIIDIMATDGGFIPYTETRYKYADLNQNVGTRRVQNIIEYKAMEPCSSLTINECETFCRLGVGMFQRISIRELDSDGFDTCRTECITLSEKGLDVYKWIIENGKDYELYPCRIPKNVEIARKNVQNFVILGDKTIKNNENN